ncbi:hypothetical protein [Nocardia stercoris]|uniref:PPE domain-containing protein n=1 Tax=Nocardia stercoris TaxID=2483361 RepID=A0A3M2L069_9NOCA|nr:hypothetical protein [Nocardia stercoris]RMI30794.1 hypothetical protein EBN03_19205 [Nocardia stercoris]
MAPDPLSIAQQAKIGADTQAAKLSYKDTDPSYIQNKESFDSAHYDYIVGGVNSMDPQHLHSTAKAWRDIAGAVNGAITGLHMSVEHELQSLQGKAASAAAAAKATFVSQVTDAHVVMLDVAQRISSTAYGAEAVRTAVQGAQGDIVTTAVPLTMGGITFPGVPDPSSLSTDQSKAVQETVAAMNNIYKPIFDPAGDGVPTFVPVSKPGGPGSGIPGGPSGPGNPGSPSNTGDPNSPGTQNNPGSPTGDPATTTGPAGLSPSNTAPANPQNQNPLGTQTAPAGVAPAGVLPDLPGLPSSTGSPAGPGGPGIGIPGGPGGNVPGGPGGSVPGGPGSTVNGVVTAGPRGTAGTAGLPGGMSPGAGGKGKGEEEDGEHLSPDYLVMDRSDELIGRVDGTVPQAIGANVPAASNQVPPGPRGGGQRVPPAGPRPF